MVVTKVKVTLLRDVDFQGVLRKSGEVVDCELRDGKYAVQLGIGCWLILEDKVDAELKASAPQDVDEAVHGLWATVMFFGEPVACCECGAEIKQAEFGPYPKEALYRPASSVHGPAAWKCSTHHQRRRYEIAATVEWYKGAPRATSEYAERDVCFECGEKIPPGTPVFEGACWPDRTPIGSRILRHVTCSPPKGRLL